MYILEYKSSNIRQGNQKQSTGVNLYAKHRKKKNKV